MAFLQISPCTPLTRRLTVWPICRETYAKKTFNGTFGEVTIGVGFRARYHDFNGQYNDYFFEHEGLSMTKDASMYRITGGKLSVPIDFSTKEIAESALAFMQSEPGDC